MGETQFVLYSYFFLYRSLSWDHGLVLKVRLEKGLWSLIWMCGCLFDVSCLFEEFTVIILILLYVLVNGSFNGCRLVSNLFVLIRIHV